jgi:dUTP pyrophosphatase
MLIDKIDSLNDKELNKKISEFVSSANKIIKNIDNIDEIELTVTKSKGLFRLSFIKFTKFTPVPINIYLGSYVFKDKSSFYGDLNVYLENISVSSIRRCVNEESVKDVKDILISFKHIFDNNFLELSVHYEEYMLEDYKTDRIITIDQVIKRTTNFKGDDKVRERGFEFISKNQMIKDLKKAQDDNHMMGLTETLNGVIEEIEDLNDDQGIDSLDRFIFPYRATRYSAGHDLYLPIEITLVPDEEILLPFGIRAYMMKDESMDIYPRSGLGFKYYIRLANTVGIIDSFYYHSDNEGSIWIKIRNEGNKVMNVELGEAIAQAKFSKYLIADTESFDKGEIRNGGMGSTSK